MKRIEAVIRQDRLPEVKQALCGTPHRGLTVSTVTEQDADCRVTVRWRAQSRIVDLVPRVRVAVLVDDQDARGAVDAVVKAARTDRESDGTIVVMPVDEVVSISNPVATAASA